MKRCIPFVLVLSLAACATAQRGSAPPMLFKSIAKPDLGPLRDSRDAAKRQVVVPSAGSVAAKIEAISAYQAAEKALTEGENREIDERLTAVLRDCNAVITRMADQVASQESNSFWLSMSGLIAGAVLAPAATAANAMAHRAFISAASGWAGATNLASQTLRTVGLAGDAVASTRNQIITNMNIGITQATNTALSLDERFAGVQKTQAACIAFAVTVPGAVPPIPAPAASAASN